MSWVIRLDGMSQYDDVESYASQAKSTDNPKELLHLVESLQIFYQTLLKELIYPHDSSVVTVNEGYPSHVFENYHASFKLDAYDELARLSEFDLSWIEAGRWVEHGFETKDDWVTNIVETMHALLENNRISAY